MGSGSSAIGVEPVYELGPDEYLGTASNGMGGDLAVKVTVEDGAITAIETLLNNETPNIGTRAINLLVPAIIEAQSTAVDNVAGATVTYAAFVAAVDQALASAGIAPTAA